MKRLCRKLAIAGLILTLQSGMYGCPLLASPAVSANVPLNSYVYEYLDKLDGLGYLDTMRTGNKPYSRVQVADWVSSMADKMGNRTDVPVYAQQMLKQLQEEFGNLSPQFRLKELRLTAHSGYETLSYRPAGMAASYQPLNSNNNGLSYSANSGGILYSTFEGVLGNQTIVSVTPRLYTDTNQSKAAIETGYIKVGTHNLEVQLGKSELWWGQGERGTLALSNNAEPFTGIKFSTLHPIKPAPVLKFLGSSHFSFFYAPMESDRTDVKSPSFVAMRADFQPSRNFTFGAARTSMVGGDGHALSHSDYWKFLSGTNAQTASEDKWNSIAGFDFRWRLPSAQGAQLYGEIYGEDQAKMLIIPGPSKVAVLAGIHIPRLSRDGSWDAQLEWAQTTTAWYTHSLYQNGYVYRGNILGDAMGRNASRYYARLGHYFRSADCVSLNFEHVVQDRTSSTPQTVDAIWLSAEKRISNSLQLAASAGHTKVTNKGYTPVGSNSDSVLSLSVIHTY